MHPHESTLISRKKIVWMLGLFSALVLLTVGCPSRTTPTPDPVVVQGQVPAQAAVGAPVQLGSCNSTPGTHEWAISTAASQVSIATLTGATANNCRTSLPAGNAVSAAEGTVTLRLVVTTPDGESSKDFAMQVTAAPVAGAAATDAGGGTTARTPAAGVTRTPVARPTVVAPAATTAPAPAATSAPAAAATQPAPTSTPRPAAATAVPAPAASPASGCASPNVELTRNGSTGCVTQAVCVSTGFGWKVSGSKCVGPPPCADGYAYDNGGTCRTPKYACAHPQLDYDHLATCTTRADCAPASEGYSISGTDCVYTVTCSFGYSYNSEFGDCETDGYGCPYPLLDIDTEQACISPDDCFALAYAVADSQCIIVEPTCESGYFFDATFGCITSLYGCTYPDLDFPTGPENCVSPGFCQPQSDGYFVVGTECIYEPPVDA